MSAITFRQFASITALNESVAALLKYNFELEYPAPHAVMLSGGNTPLEAYRLLARASCVVSPGLHLFFSDERLVPVASSVSNFGNLRPMLEALHLNENQVIRVQPELEPDQAADRYDTELRKFVNRGGRITLGLLGLGADGHTASLFNEKDLEHGRGRYAIVSIAPDGIRRVSVTVDLLSKIQQVVFVVAGDEKQAVVEKLTADPSGVVAGLAVAGVKRKQLWFAAGRDSAGK